MEQLYSSFNDVDWQEISSYVERKGGVFTSQKVESIFDVINSCCGQDALAFEMAALYYSGSQDIHLKQIYDELMDGRVVENILGYTGYILDEYNMIRKCAKTFESSAKIFKKPIEKLAQNILVTASGPSLDDSIHVIKELQDSHIIVAAGSSFRTLIENNIRVDYLVIVERSDIVYQVYKEYVESITAPIPVLIMANTCHHQLLDVFPQVITFFRPATSAHICSLR